MPFDPRRGALDVLFLDGHNWRLAAPLLYWTEQGGSIRVPAGFMTDFASIPRGLWNILPPTGPYAPAAVIHDYLYRGGGFESELRRLEPSVWVRFAGGYHWTSPPRPTRREADDIFYDAMRELGVGAVKARVIWLAVRLFGGGPYQEEPRARKTA